MIRSILVAVDPAENYLATQLSVYRGATEAGFLPPPEILGAAQLSPENIQRFALVVGALQAEASVGGWRVIRAIVEKGPTHYELVTPPDSPVPEPTLNLSLTEVFGNGEGERTRSVNTRSLPGPVAEAVWGIWQSL